MITHTVCGLLKVSFRALILFLYFCTHTGREIPNNGNYILSLNVVSINLIMIVLCKTIIFIDIDKSVSDTQFLGTYHNLENKFSSLKSKFSETTVCDFLFTYFDLYRVKFVCIKHV